MVDNALEYATKLVGKPYGGWTPDLNMLDQDEPFFAFDSIAPDPLNVNSASCAGLINLMRRRLGLNIPGSGLYKGGTYQWFCVLEEKDMLKEISPDKSYPIGTLLIRNYTDVDDQGHVAVVYEQGTSLKTSKIIHSCFKGIVIETIEDIQYYSHISYPKDWLEELV